MAIAAENIVKWKTTSYLWQEDSDSFLAKMLMSAVILAGHIPCSLNAEDAKFWYFVYFISTLLWCKREANPWYLRFRTIHLFCSCKNSVQAKVSESDFQPRFSSNFIQYVIFKIHLKKSKEFTRGISERNLDSISMLTCTTIMLKCSFILTK